MPISMLIDERERRLKACIENLRIVDISTAEDFERIRHTIKQEVLLKPINFDKPHLVNHNPVVKPGLVLRLINSFKQLFIREIAFPFTGTGELFDYVSESACHGSEPHLRRNGNYLIVTVLGFFLSKERALTEAMLGVSPTMQVVAGNNIVAEGWSRRAKEKLDKLLELKREELLRLYGLAR